MGLNIIKARHRGRSVGRRGRRWRRGRWRCGPRLGADVVLGENAPGSQQQREARAGPLVGRDVLGEHEAALAALRGEKK